MSENYNQGMTNMVYTKERNEMFYELMYETREDVEIAIETHELSLKNEPKSRHTEDQKVHLNNLYLLLQTK